MITQQPSQTEIDIATRVLNHLSENRNDLPKPEYQHFRVGLGRLVRLRKKQQNCQNVQVLCCAMKKKKMEEKREIQKLLTEESGSNNQLCKIKKNLKERQKFQAIYSPIPIIGQELLEGGLVENQAILLEGNQKHLKCYVCKAFYTKLHHFYDQLCPDCATFNFSKRTQECNLFGKIALVTGGRMKIGYCICLILLRNGCQTVVTTRFPKDAARRFAQETDFPQFKDRLEIYGLDFRHSSSITEFCDFFKQKYGKLDILINNAAQTIRKGLDLTYMNIQGEFDGTEYPKEIVPEDFANLSLTSFLQGNQVKSTDIVVPHTFDRCEISKSALVSLIDSPSIDAISKVDTRSQNSWTSQLDNVGLTEFMEVQFINAAAPFLFCSRLKCIMSTPSFIINVSAMEGQFYRTYKNTTHPHTNMAKAALNMMTRTAGAYYAQSQVYMNSVDTGWVTDENPNSHERNQTVPLDEIDGAMRVLDPIFMGFNEKKYQHSRFFKDYKETLW